MGQSVDALENQYVLLRSSLSGVTALGATPEQMNALKTQIVKSRTNYWTAINKIFHEDDPAVEALVTKMNTDQLSLKAAIDNLGKVTKILDAITKAVEVGSQLAAKAIAL